VDIRGNNPGLVDGIPGRIDVLKAMTLQPLDEVAVNVIAYTLADASGRIVPTYQLNTEMRLRLTVAAPLAEARNVTVRVGNASIATWNVTWLTSEVQLGTIPAGGETTTVDLAFRVTADDASALPIIVRLFVGGDEAGEQMVIINPTPVMHRFANDSIIVDVGIQGALGATGSRANRQGAGFNVVGRGNVLSPSGFFATLGITKAAQAIDDIGAPSNFVTEKPFSSGDTSIAMFTSPAGETSAQLGLQVMSRVTFPSKSEPVVVFSYVLRNITNEPLSNVGAALAMDWDVGSGGTNNRTERRSDAVPEGLPAVSNAAQAFWRNGFPLALVVGTSSANADAVVQSGGSFLNEVIANDRTPPVLGALLTTGTTLQADNFEGDMAGLHGMRFTSPIAPGEERSFIVVVGSGPTVDAAANHVRRRMANPASVAGGTSPSISVYPNPATSVLMVDGLEDGALVELWSADGRRFAMLRAAGTSLDVPITTNPAGSYIVRVLQASSVTTIPVVIVR
jgi:hypothetical protein